MLHTYDGMTINKVRSRKPLQPTVSKRNTPRTVLTQIVTSFKKEKKNTQRGTQASKFCYIRRELFNRLSICFVFCFFFLAKGVSSVR